MKPQTFNADALRAALRTTEVRLVELLKDLELNDVDETTMTSRIRDIEKGLRRMARAA